MVSEGSIGCSLGLHMSMRETGACVFETALLLAILVTVAIGISGFGNSISNKFEQMAISLELEGGGSQSTNGFDVGQSCTKPPGAGRFWAPPPGCRNYSAADKYP